jgi:predicted nucleotidyltransferase
MSVIALTTQQLEAIRELCHAFEVAKLELFGSGARDDFDPDRSDVDILVEYMPDIDLGPWMSRYFELQEGLEVVLGRKVDLVMASALQNPYLIASINRARRVLYAA